MNWGYVVDEPVGGFRSYVRGHEPHGRRGWESRAEKHVFGESVRDTRRPIHRDAGIHKASGAQGPDDQSVHTCGGRGRWGPVHVGTGRVPVAAPVRDVKPEVTLALPSVKPDNVSVEVPQAVAAGVTPASNGIVDACMQLIYYETTKSGFHSIAE